MQTRRCDVFKVKCDLIAYDAAIETIERWRQNGKRRYVAMVNPYSVVQCHRDKELCEAVDRADMNLPDGVGIILAASLLGYRHKGRVTGPTLMLKVCDQGRQYGYRHYFYGGGNGMIEKLARELARKYPGLQIAGTYSSPFGPLTAQETDRIIEMINSSNPDIVWVGLGTPKQEKWMAKHVGKIRAAAMVGVGAAFAYHSGSVRWAPGWIRKLGLEWAYRLVQEPKRMWRRNLDSLIFLTKVMYQLLCRGFEFGTFKCRKAVSLIRTKLGACAEVNLPDDLEKDS